MKKWRGIHIPTRYLPESYFECFLLGQFEARNHPLCLEFWVGAQIKTAEYDKFKI